MSVPSDAKCRCPKNPGSILRAERGMAEHTVTSHETDVRKFAAWPKKLPST